MVYNLILCIAITFAELLSPEELNYRGSFFTQNDISIMERVVMSEASTEPFECKQAVAATIINRYLSDEFPNNLPDIIAGQFSTQDNGEPTQDCKDAVQAALDYPDCFPPDMYWFRTGHYHEFSKKVYDYTCIGRTYFSTATDWITEPEEEVVYIYD